MVSDFFFEQKESFFYKKKTFSVTYENPLSILEAFIQLLFLKSSRKEYQVLVYMRYGFCLSLKKSGMERRIFLRVKYCKR